MKHGWEYKKLDNIALIKGRIGYRGYTKNDLVPAGEGAITLSPANIIDYKISYEKCQYISWFKYEESPEIMIYNGDVIYAKTASIGKVALVRDLPEKATINPQFVVLKEIKCYNTYLYYVLRSNYFKQAISLITNGVAIPTVSQSNMGNINIPIPPIEEQKSICSLLDKLSLVIEKKKQQVKELDNLAQAIFYDMFGDPVENEKGWEIKKMGEVCQIDRGGSPRPIDQYITDDPKGINWIKIGDATDGGMVIKTVKEKIRPEGVKKSRFVHKGDFLLSNSMSYGKPYILGVDGCIHDGWLVISDEKEVFDKVFLYYFLGNPQTYECFRKMAVGGVVNNLNKEMVKKLNVIIPPQNIQQSFAQKVESIERQKELINQSIREAQTLFDSRMEYYFGE